MFYDNKLEGFDGQGNNEIDIQRLDPDQIGQKGHRIYQRDRQMQELNEDQGSEMETDKEVC